MSAEWCQHDDVVLHWEGTAGEKATIRLKFEGLTLPEVFKDWHSHKAGNMRLTGSTDRPTILVLGPPCKWRVVHIESNHGWVLDPRQPEYPASAAVTFTMSKGVASAPGT